jgi:DNA-nicking Smr family endonuclease
VSKKTLNGSLGQLGELIQKAGIRLKSEEASVAVPPQRAEKEMMPAASPKREFTDDELFSEAMNEVQRVSWKHDLHPSSKPAKPSGPEPEVEDHRLMQEAMEEDFPIPDHPEYIEGWVGVSGKRFLPNLRNGLYSIQGQIDLHGLNRNEAQTAVEDYIIRMSRFRSCCVKIIHGRGINSPADRATLKESLQRLLSTRRMSRYVVAYASAPSRDGGVGAVYVLLSRQ